MLQTQTAAWAGSAEGSAEGSEEGSEEGSGL